MTMNNLQLPGLLAVIMPNRKGITVALIAAMNKSLTNLDHDR